MDRDLIIKNEFAKIFNVKDSESIQCTAEAKGINNYTYKVIYDGKGYFFRMPGDDTSVFNNRKNEKDVYTKLKDSHLTDEVLYFNENTGIKVTKYYFECRGINKDKDEELADCMKAYRALHSVKAKVDSSIEIYEIFDRYLEMYNENKSNCGLKDLEESLNLCKTLSSKFTKIARPKRLCHGDGTLDNLIYTEDGFKLIDFEFAGMADPMSDIAVFAVGCTLSIKEAFKLYDYYKDSKPVTGDDLYLDDVEGNKKLLAEYMVVTCMSSALWGLVSMVTRNYYELTDYIKNRYELFNKYLEEKNKYEKQEF